MARAGKLGLTAPPNQAGISDWGGEHIRLMTLGALKDLLKFNGFQIMSVKGAHGTIKGVHGTLSGQGLAMGLVQTIDKAMCAFPSFASWSVVKAMKQ